MNIAGKPVGGSGVYFIAEAGINHNGDIDRATEMIEVAAKAGADAVKFQTFDADRLVREDAPKADYQEEKVDESQHEMLRVHELTEADHRTLMEACERENVTFLSTPFDLESLQFLDSLDIPAIKLGSGELDNEPLLREAAGIGRPLIVSTGMGTQSEVERAYEWVAEEFSGDPETAFLHCVSAYPTPMEEVNLRAMQRMAEYLPCPAGFSDHTTAIETPGFAVAAGATVIEKHFTLDRSLPGPDHEASLEPDELKRAVDLARTAAVARGSPEKEPTPSERDNRSTIRKSVHAARDLPSGAELSEEDILILRPADGLSPTEFCNLPGRKTSRPLSEGAPIDENALMDR